MTYRPPFVSERVGETHINGCTFAAGLMTIFSWTSGDLVPPNPTQPVLRKLREQLEPGPTTQTRGWDPLDVDVAARKHWADLDLPHIPSWDNPDARLRIDFPEWRGRIIAGECGSLAGNVRKVKDSGSPLHKFVNPVDHDIYVESSPDPAFAHVLDPMGLPTDTYNGDRVKWDDLEQFGSEFSGAGFMFVSLVPKGAQSTVSLNSQITQLTKDLKLTTQQRDTAQKRVRQLLDDLDVANTNLTSAQSDLKTAQTALADCQSGTDLTTCRADLAAAQQAVTDAEAAQKTAEDRVNAFTTWLAGAPA